MSAGKRAEPPVTFVVSQPTCCPGVVHLHATDRVERRRGRWSDEAQLVQLNPLSDMTEGETSEFSHRDGLRTSGGGDESGPKGLSALCLAGHSGRQIDRRAEPVVASTNGRPMVQTGARHREALEILASSEQPLQRGKRGLRGLEAQHHGVAQALDQLITWFERGASEVDESLDLADGFFITMDLGKGGEAGEINERK